VELDEAIRTRRTTKVYGSEPVDAATIEELVELARWAPNHHVTNPWRFRALGPRSLERLKAVAEAAKPGSAAKLERAPTLVVVSVVQTGDAEQDREDLLATGVAAYIVLLAAHGRGLAGYWRTVGALDSPDGRAAIGLPDDEAPVGLLYLGHPRQDERVPERAPVADVLRHLD
jgi:nitroreductase